jgi:hypothetical protein
VVTNSQHGTDTQAPGASRGQRRHLARSVLAVIPAFSSISNPRWELGRSRVGLGGWSYARPEPLRPDVRIRQDAETARNAPRLTRSERPLHWRERIGHRRR